MFIPKNDRMTFNNINETVVKNIDFAAILIELKILSPKKVKVNFSLDNFHLCKKILIII